MNGKYKHTRKKVSVMQKIKAITKAVAIAIAVVLITLLIGVRIYQLTVAPAVVCEVSNLTAKEGYTYWQIDSIALCVGGFDKQDRINKIIDFNGGSASIRIGQVINLPTNQKEVNNG